MRRHWNSGYNKALRGRARELRKRGPRSEIHLWVHLLNRRKMRGFQFLRQRPVLTYVADFMCKDLKLIIEIDGFTHDSEAVQAKDSERDEHLRAAGFTVLRFRDEEVLRNTQWVRRRIEEWIDRQTVGGGRK